MRPKNAKTGLLPLLACMFACPAIICAADNVPAKLDARYPYRTDFANENLPWYQLQPGVFPPSHAETRQTGELLEVDAIHRTGRFRRTKTGETVEFSMLPFAIAHYCGSEVELRDVPVGTRMLFFVFQDERGNWTRVANLMDDFSIAASHSETLRIEAIDLAVGKISAIRQSLPKMKVWTEPVELTVREDTRVWKGPGTGGTLADLAVGQAIILNTAPVAQGRGPCTDIWCDAESQTHATETQRAKRLSWLKERGLPGWIDRVEGRQLAISLFNRESQALVDESFAVNSRIHVAVAEENLQVYDPGVDKVSSAIVAINKQPAHGYASAHRQLVVEPKLILEGFRKSRVVRVFAEGWPVKSPPPEERLFP